MNINKNKQNLSSHSHYAHSPKMAKHSKKKQETSNKTKAHTTKAGKRHACGTDGEIDEKELSVSVTHRRKKAKLSVAIEEVEDGDSEIEEIDVTSKPASDDSDEVSHVYNY